METPDAAVTITDVAAGKIRDLVAAGDGDQALRIAVRGADWATCKGQRARQQQEQTDSHDGNSRTGAAPDSNRRAA